MPAGPSIGELMNELIVRLAEAQSGEEKAAVIGVLGDMFAEIGFQIMVGVPVADEEPVVVFAIPDVSDKVAEMFIGTPWASGGWATALRTMPGAFSGLIDMTDETSTATFVPLPVLAETFGYGMPKQ